MDPSVAKCLMIARVLVADGIMAPAEKELLGRSMEAMGLSPEQRQRVYDLEGLEEAERLVGGLSDAEKQELLDRVTAAALVDGKLSPYEQEVVARIATALGRSGT